jgi:uncharacterized membrane protein
MKPEQPLQAEIQTASASNEPVRDQDKIMLVFAYLGVLALIPLLTVKDSDFVRWHAKNGLILGVATVVLVGLLSFVPLLSCVVLPLGCIAFVILTVMAITKALRGERWRIPGVSDIADKF